MHEVVRMDRGDDRTTGHNSSSDPVVKKASSHRELLAEVEVQRLDHIGCSHAHLAGFDAMVTLVLVLVDALPILRTKACGLSLDLGFAVGIAKQDLSEGIRVDFDLFSGGGSSPADARPGKG